MSKNRRKSSGLGTGIVDALRALRSSGPTGFEGLIKRLLEELTGQHFFLAQSGFQGGRDLSSRPNNANVIDVECKRYGPQTELSQRELLGEIAQATRSRPDLDIWVLAATRSIDSQLDEALNAEATQRGIAYVAISVEESSDQDKTVSSLVTLCAQVPNVFMAFLGPELDADHRVRLTNELQEVANHPQFPHRLQQLRESLCSPLIGYDSWRRTTNSTLLKHFSSASDSHAHFGQIVNVQDTNVKLIERKQIHDALDTWLQNWSVQQEQFVLCGEEGDGKTWGVASWLSKGLQHDSAFPPVLFCTSQNVSSTEPQDLFSELIARGMQTGRREQWEKRLQRWVTREPTDGPALIVVLDGINERRGAAWWRSLLQKLQASPWCDQVAVVVTCRTAFWDRHFQPLRSLLTTVHTISPYDDDELSAALLHHGLSWPDIHSTLLPLIRKPRYFDLMVRHRRVMAESGDVTRARLVYEDWRDRIARKSGPIDHLEFQSFIQNLAEKHQTLTRQFIKQQEVEELISSNEEKLEELRTGGILFHEGSRYRVNELMLQYGFGLLLVEQIQETVDAGRSVEDSISEWLEPHPEMDIKAAICNFAALHALETPRLPRSAKVALLSTWVNSTNPESSAASDFVANFPLDPQSYIELAEIVWANRTENAWAQDLLLHSLLKWRDSPKFRSVLHATLERWLGYVNIHGSPWYRGETEEDAQRERQKITDRLGRELTPGPFAHAGYALTAIDDNGLLRLGRVALAIISHLPRQHFMRSLVVGCLAEAIMGHADKYDFFAWVLRTAQDPVWDAVEVEVRKLLATNTLVATQAAHRLLSFEGSAAAYQLREMLPNNLFPVGPVQQMLEREPCAFPYPWDSTTCKKCIHRTDFAPEQLARLLRNVSVDPDLPLPQEARDGFNGVPDSIEADAIWSTRFTGSEDLKYEEYEPALCAFAPHAIAGFVRRAVNTVAARSGLPLRQISHQLSEHSLLFTNEQRESIYQAWLQLIQSSDRWTQGEEETEVWLFSHVLQYQDGVAQLHALIQRPETAWNRLSYPKYFKPVDDGQELITLLNTAKDDIPLQRILWFLSANAEGAPAEVVEKQILPLLKHENTFIRSLVLQIIYRSRNTTAAEQVAKGSWAWHTEHNFNENHWGSLLLAEFGSTIPYAELRCRIEPVYLGFAVQSRGGEEAEVAELAEDIDAVWSILGTKAPDLPVDLPALEIDGDASEDKPVKRELVGLSSSDFSRTSTFFNRNASWGGIRKDSFHEWTTNLNDVFDKRQALMKSTFDDAVKEQSEAGNNWFGRRFHSESLDAVCAARPDLLNKWIESAFEERPTLPRYVRLGSSFYQTLCMRLFHIDPAQGVRLYWRLREVGLGIRVIGKTKIDYLEYALFEAPVTSDVVAAWERRLSECTTDKELLEVALVAQAGNGSNWLWRRIESGVQSLVPLEKAQAITLLGFSDAKQAPALIERLLSEFPDTWPRRLIATAQQRQQMNVWAQHWFERFFQEESPDLAWASFRLFLRCVDTRFWHWKSRVQPKDVFARERALFVEANNDTIQNHIKDNEAELGKHFLGEKIHRDEIWPWMWTGPQLPS